MDPNVILRTAQAMQDDLGAVILNNQEQLKKSIRKLEQRIMAAMKDLKTGPDGLLMGPRVNLKLAQAMHKDLVKIFEEEYGVGVRRAVKGFNDVATAIKKNWPDLDEAIQFTRVDRDIMHTLQNQALNEYIEFGSSARERMAQNMYDYVSANGSYAALVEGVREIIGTGVDKRGMSMARYADLWANDGVMNFHQQVTLKKAKDAGLTMFLYYGNVIQTSRPFCIDRAGKVFSRQQIDSWNDLSWQGKSGPALTRRGGYNCRHHWHPVKKAWLPDDGIDVQDYFVEENIKINRGKTIPKWPGVKGVSKRVKPTPVNPYVDPHNRWVPTDDIEGPEAKAWAEQMMKAGQEYSEAMGIGPCGPVADNIVEVLQAQGRDARVMFTHYRPPNATSYHDIFPHYVAVEVDEAGAVKRIYDPTNPFRKDKPIWDIKPGAKPHEYWPRDGVRMKLDEIDEWRDETEVFAKAYRESAAKSGPGAIYGKDDYEYFFSKMAKPGAVIDAGAVAADDVWEAALKLAQGGAEGAGAEFVRASRIFNIGTKKRIDIITKARRDIPLRIFQANRKIEQIPINRIRLLEEGTWERKALRNYKGVDPNDPTFFDRVTVIKYKEHYYIEAGHDYLASMRLGGVRNVFADVIDMDAAIAQNIDVEKRIVYKWKPTNKKAEIRKQFDELLQAGKDDPKYARYKSGPYGDANYGFYRFSHTDFSRLKNVYANNPEKLEQIMGILHMPDRMSVDALNAIGHKLAELQNRCDALGIPKLRCLNINNLGRSAAASMGDGVMSLNTDTYLHYLSDYDMDLKKYQAALQKFVDDSEHILAAVARTEGKGSELYKGLKEAIDDRVAEIKRLKDGTFQVPKFGMGKSYPTTKFKPSSGAGYGRGGFPPRPYKGPDVTTSYFEKGLERAYKTMEHEFGHHVHQQLFVQGEINFLTSPPFENWLKRFFEDLDVPKYLGKVSKYAGSKHVEWFAENYGMWKAGLKGHVQEELWGIMEALDDLEAGKITEGQLSKLMFQDGKFGASSVAKANATLVRASKSYSIAETGLPKEAMNIVNQLKDFGEYGTSITQLRVNLGVSDSYEIRNALRDMVEKGLVEAIGSPTDRKYRLVASMR